MIPLVIYQRADKITIVFDKRVLGKIKQERKMTMKLSKTSILVELDLSNWDISKITENKNAFNGTSKLEFLSFKKLPQEHRLTKFAGKYKVDVLKADGTLVKHLKFIKMKFI